MNHRKISAKGGKAGRGAAKARTSEQARAAAQAGWAKRRKEMFGRDEINRDLATQNTEMKTTLERIAKLTLALHDSPLSLHEQMTAWARSSLPNVKVSRDHRDEAQQPFNH